MHAVSEGIRLDHVDRRYPGGVVALQDVSLQVAPGEFVALVGPSGCGKSTILRLLAGLDAPTRGRVEAPALADSREAATAFVFQEPTLMPWASVFDNVWLPLRLAGVTRAQAAAQVRELLRSMGLGDFERAYPAELSGGMRMRASIARALVTRPRVLLMDEPFAALDEITRGRLNADLLAWWTERSLAVVFVTHSVYESVFLSQRVLVMSERPGRVTAEITIEEPYPRTAAFRATAAYQDACRRVSAALVVA
jgi:NitT/TauT family transport system ATP-binding protein